MPQQTETIKLSMPDGTLVEVDVTFTATFEKNPYDKEPQHNRGSDDGWVIEDLELK